MGDIFLIWKNLTRKKLRFVLLLISILVSFMIYTVLVAFQNAMDAGVDLSADDRLIVVNKINFTQSLPMSYMNRIAAVEGVAYASHLNWFGGYFQDPKNFMAMFAVSNDQFFEVYDELVVDAEHKRNYLSNRRGLLAGKSTADRFGWKVGDRIPVSSNIFSNVEGGQSWEFDVEAIYEGTDPQVDTSSVYFHFEYYNESVTFGRDIIGMIGIKTTSVDINDQVIQAIDEQFANSPAETETMPEKAFSKQFIEQIGNISLIIQSVVFAAFFTILMLVGNSMVMAVRERTREIAVMKTLGFESGRIFRMVLSESMLLSLTGGLIGMLVGGAMLGVLNNLPGVQLPTMLLDANLAVQAIAIMLLLGFVTGVIPAWSALRLNIVTAFTKG